MMLPDHIAFGMLLPCTFKRFRNLPAILISVLASETPDLAVIFSGGPGTIGYLTHRTFTHSFVLAPVFCILPLLIIYMILRKRATNTVPELYLASLLAYCVHIFLDLITPFGTQLLYPFNVIPYSLDIFHAFDPAFLIVSVSLIVTLLVHFAKRRPFGSRLILCFLGIYCTYALGTAIHKHTTPNLIM